MNLGIVGIVNFNEWDNPDYPETGGINSVIKTIIPYLKADSISLYGITDDKRKLFVETRLSPHISAFPVVYVGKQSWLPKRLAGLLYGWRLNRYLQSHQIDFIHCHAEEFGLWLTLSKIPYIYHLHTYVNVLEVSGRKLAKIKLLHKVWHWMRVRVIKHSYKIVAVNKDIVALGEELVGKDRIIEFPNYIDLKAFKYRDSEGIRKKFNVLNERIALFIGRLSMVKGIELFVDTVEELNRQSNDRWIGIIVGNGEYEQLIRNYIENKHVDKMFLFTGSINNKDELSKVYSLANVFLITSFSEIVPLTLLESLSCGTPVVSTSVGISKQVLTENNGYVVDSRKPADFAKAILNATHFKTEQNLLPNSFKYSVEFASQLLNSELESYSTVQNAAGNPQ